MGLASTSLNSIYGAVAPKMNEAETVLKELLSKIPDGGDITTAQLLQLQVAMAKYTITSTVFSNVIKEFSDALKGTANKIG
jgi:hypothetical protein